MPLVIQLDGLICHVGNDEDHKDMAVLVEEGSHHPEIFIAKQYRTDDRTRDFQEKLHKGDLVEFDDAATGGDLPPGPADTSSAFKALTPRLQRLLEDSDVAKNDIDPEVKSKTHNDNKIALAYVVYPGGTLTAIDPVDDQLKCTLSNGTVFEQCVADEARLTSTNTTEVKVTITGRKTSQNHTVTLVADAVVQIRNRGRGNFFHAYRGLTLSGKMAQAELGSACRQAAPAASESTHTTSKRRRKKYRGGPNDPACTNSAWP